MTSKPLLLFLLILISCDGQENKDIGRYQISQGSFKRISSHKGIEEFEEVRTIIKIDTLTGKTWFFEAGAVGDIPFYKKYNYDPLMFKDKWSQMGE